MRWPCNDGSRLAPCHRAFVRCYSLGVTRPSAACVAREGPLKRRNSIMRLRSRFTRPLLSIVKTNAICMSAAVEDPPRMLYFPFDPMGFILQILYSPWTLPVLSNLRISATFYIAAFCCIAQCMSTAVSFGLFLSSLIFCESIICP